MGKLGKHAVVLLSGGQDSGTCFYWALEHFDEVDAISFNYGQNHSIETKMAKKLCDKESVQFKNIDITEIMSLSKSALTDKNGDVNQTRADGLPASFVPNRNLIFLTLANSYAQLRGADAIITGVCETDFSGYPDCRQVFIDSLMDTLALATAGAPIPIITPLMYRDKADTFLLAEELGVLETIRTKTMTCYNGDQTLHDYGRGCGKCPSCKLRKAGYEEFLKRKKHGNDI